MSVEESVELVSQQGRGDTKTGGRTWPQRIIDDPEVKDLSSDGKTLWCVLCKKGLKLRHPFALGVWNTHRESGRHLEFRDMKRKLGEPTGVEKEDAPPAKKHCSNALAAAASSENEEEDSTESTDCQGMIPYPDEVETSIKLSAFYKYASLDEHCRYRFQMLNGQPQLYSNSCDNRDVWRFDARLSGRRCAECHALNKNMAKSFRKTIAKRAGNFLRAEECARAESISEEDKQLMYYFAKLPTKSLNENGIELLNRVKHKLETDKEQFQNDVSSDLLLLKSMVSQAKTRDLRDLISGWIYKPPRSRTARCWKKINPKPRVFLLSERLFNFSVR